MSENTIIRRVREADAGCPEDGVEMMAKCSVMYFKVKGKEIVGIKGQRLSDCKMLASFDNGAVSISVRDDQPFIVSVRLDELMALLKEAADYHKESTRQGNK